jgi:hypothetical protein
MFLELLENYKYRSKKKLCIQKRNFGSLEIAYIRKAYSDMANIAICENKGKGVGSTKVIFSANPILKRQVEQFFIACANRQHLQVAIYDVIFSSSLMAQSSFSFSGRIMVVRNFTIQWGIIKILTGLIQRWINLDFRFPNCYHCKKKGKIP